MYVCWKPHFMGSTTSLLMKTKMKIFFHTVGNNRSGKIPKIIVVRKME